MQSTYLIILKVSISCVRAWTIAYKLSTVQCPPQHTITCQLRLFPVWNLFIYHQLFNFSHGLSFVQTEDETANLLKPVILLEAVNHAAFFSGVIPPTVAETDILSELAGEDARVLIGARCAAFLSVVRADADAAEAEQALRDDYTATGEFLAPLYELQRQEADEAGGSPWSERAQRYMFNVLEESVIVDIQSYHMFNLSELEHQHNQLNVTGELCPEVKCIALCSKLT